MENHKLQTSAVNRKKIIRRKIIYILVDVLIVTASFLVFVWYKPATVRIYLPTYAKPFSFFLGVWLFVGFIIAKYNLHKARNTRDVIIPILITNLTILAVVTTLIYSFGAFYYSRLIVFGTMALSTVLELMLAYLFISVKRPVIIPEFEAPPVKPRYYPTDKTFRTAKKEEARYVETRLQIRQIVVDAASENVYQFISRYVDVGNPANLTLSTTTSFNIEQLPPERFNSLVNLHQINDIRRINKFFEVVNQRLPFGGIYISSAETYPLRKARILGEHPPVLNHIYYFFDFIFTRVFPKLPVFKKFYFWVTLGRNRVLSRAETLGRLYSCGFECVDETFIEGKFYFVARKIKEPFYPESPTYGPFIRLKRYGKNGKEIGVYKMRTMHAYSEYLQEYVYMKNSLQEGGKFSNDFRVTAAGRFMRKFWLDELPMIFNLFLGDMKIVGVRPLSKHYFNLYSDELKALRTRFKPGLVPPFYVDMPKTLDEIMASEMKYLEAYEKSPFITDIRYFFRAFYNIFFRRARSK
jgi:lipopolysaccharide/colanic/teichoic acid biosynthesis glycosyltransferase